LSALLQTLRSTFGAEVWSIVGPSILQTLYMTALSTALTGVFGLALGVILVLTDRDGVHPLSVFNTILSAVINALRSMPSVIIIILTLPLSRLIIGVSYGPTACIFALAFTCIPMYARLVENAILEVPQGKIEAAKAMGSRTGEIVFKVMLPEALPALVRSFTVAIIAVISVTALAGSFGAGGLGDVAVRYGYQRFRVDMLIASVAALIALVTAVQIAGGGAAKAILKRRHLM
jgi:D-methionine transport system permease protein